jgi:cytosine permease
MVQRAHVGNYNPVELMSDILQAKFGPARGDMIANIAMIALAISSFPAACFSSLIAANSFKTTMPKVRPVISVGIGTLAAVILAVTGWTANVLGVFQVIGASFGPVCGAMLADFLLAGRKWSGPRAGFNPAGWISWIVGFGVGAFNLVVPILLKWNWADRNFPRLADYRDYVPLPPVTAFVVGFALYVVLSVVGLRTRKLLTVDGKLID